MAEHAVGSKISLISKSDIRYEGFLHFINPEENTVGLKNVRMFGTEGRKGGGSHEVPPGDQLYEFIIFRGGDIKDLTVYEDKPQQRQQQDPAIVSAQPSRSAPSRQEQQRPQTYAERAGAKPRYEDRRDDRRDDRQVQDRRDTRHYDNRRNEVGERRHDGGYDRRDGGYERRDHGGYDRRPERRDDRRHDERRHDERRHDERRHDERRHDERRHDERRHDEHRDDRRHNDRLPARGRGYGAAGGSRGQRAAPRPEAHTGVDFAPATGEAKEQFKEEFDFSKSKEAFEQRKNEFEKAKEEARAQARAYDKSSSFFDNISCEAKGNKPVRTDRDEAKKTDTETFGSEMVGSMRGFRRGRGGRGRYNRY